MQTLSILETRYEALAASTRTLHFQGHRLEKGRHIPKSKNLGRKNFVRKWSKGNWIGNEDAVFFG